MCPAKQSAAKSRPWLPIMGAAVVSGLAGYVVLVLAARVLGPETNASFLVFWGAVYGVFGALVGVTAETTRAVFSAPPRAATVVFPVVLGLVGAVATVVSLSGLLWAPMLFGESWEILLAAMSVGIVLFGLQAGFNGAAAGRSAWHAYSLSLGSEALMRLALCVLAVSVGGQLLGLAWAVVLACGTWVGWVVLRRDHRRLLTVRIADSRSAFLRRMLVACSASGASAMLLVGYPVLLRVTTPADGFAGAAPILLSVSLSRAPLLVPLGIYQNVLVTKVIAGGVGVLRPIVAGLVVVSALGSVVAWWLGPVLLHVINPLYDVSGRVFVGLVLTAGLVAALTITGAATVALNRHEVFLAGWVVATGVAVVALLLPGSLESRVLGSLAVGPLAGVAVHVGGAFVRQPRGQRS